MAFPVWNQSALFGQPEEPVEGDQVSVPILPHGDNSEGDLEALLAANAYYRDHPWPEPYATTRHTLALGDARDLSVIPDESVHLVVTSPPYWTLKQYAPERPGQLGDIANYEAFLGELDRVWRECARVLVGGGRICCVVGDVCVPRRRGGRHFVMPLHADIQVRARTLGLDVLTPILWHKIANGVTEVAGNGAGFYGKPYQPGAIIKNDVEYVLFLRKGGRYRSTEPLQRALSMLTREELRAWQRSIWMDLPGASTRGGHPAPYPVELAERLIRLFSFAGDTVFDPFLGTGSTSQAAIRTGRNSLGVEIEPRYLALAAANIAKATRTEQARGITRPTIASSDSSHAESAISEIEQLASGLSRRAGSPTPDPCEGRGGLANVSASCCNVTHSRLI